MAYQEDEEGNEPAKLNEEMRSEITEQEPIENNVRVLEPEIPIVEPEDEERFEEPTDIEITMGKKSKPKHDARKAKRRQENESRSLSKLHSELRKHSDVRKKTDLAVKDIEKQLKALLLAHHSAIKDLKKQVTQMDIKIAKFQSKKSAPKATARKTIIKKIKKEDWSDES